jgi:hypothetical protein
MIAGARTIDNSSSGELADVSPPEDRTRVLSAPLAARPRVRDVPNVDERQDRPEVRGR